jgi:glycerol-3-phosphate dehydrogenase (NAD+)
MLTPQVDGRKLTDIINETHINVKYLPDIPLGKNVRAFPNLVDAVKGATALVFVMPHQCELVKSEF